MSSLRARARTLAYRGIGATAIVLIYHRVATLERDPQLLAVTPERFDAQMRHLQEHFTVVRLARLAELKGRSAFAGRFVAVTFDDGYADNLLAAAPVLEKYEIPATVFVSSGYCRSGGEFWWDEVERIVLGPGTLPPEISIATHGGAFSHTLGGDPNQTASQADADSAWNITLADVDPRHSLYRALCEFIRPLHPAQREEALRQLRQATGHSAETRDSHRPLTLDEVAKLDASPMVSVGGHTVNHPVLSALTPAEQRDEILADKLALDEVCGRGLTEFSYPYGGSNDFDEESVRLTAEAGYDVMCANYPGPVKPWTPRTALPRNLVRDYDIDTFAEKLRGWFRGDF